MSLAEDQEMIQAVAAKRTDQAFNVWILPGRSRRNRTIPNAHRPDSTCEGVPVGPIIVAHQIGRCRIPRECLHDLLRQPVTARNGRMRAMPSAPWNAPFRRRASGMRMP